MKSLLLRLVAIFLMLWLPLSFFLPPALLLLGIHLFQFGWLGVLGGLGAIAFAVPPGLTIVLLEIRTLQQRPVNISGTILVITYNTAVFLAFSYFL